MKTTLLTAVLLSALTASACGGEDREGTTPTMKAARGSAVCHVWQDAVCAFSEKCGVTRADQCSSMLRSISCKSDEQARTCTEQLNAASCMNPPQGCDSRDLADPAPAIAACNELATAICTADNRSGRNESVDDCTTELLGRYQCERSLGVRLEFESCIENLEALACTAPAPGNCMGVILQ